CRSDRTDSWTPPVNCLVSGSFTAVPGLATCCLDFAPALRQSWAMCTKKIAAFVLLLALAACQTAPRHQASLPPAYPPPPPPAQAGRRRYQPPPPPPQAAKPALPRYSKPAGPLVAANEGRYIDEMEHDLRRILHGVPVARPGDVLVLNFRSD